MSLCALTQIVHFFNELLSIRGCPVLNDLFCVKIIKSINQLEDSLDTSKAYEIFMSWYEACLEAGIEPNDVVQKVGGMFLLTDEALIDQLKEDGVI